MVVRVDWSALKDVHGRPADRIPDLLAAMGRDLPEIDRRKAGEEFWERIIGEYPVFATATPPAISEYLRMAKDGRLDVNGELVFAVSAMWDECAVSTDDPRSQALLKSNVRSIIEGYEEWYWQLFEQHGDSTVRDLVAQLLGQFAPNKPKLAESLSRRYALTQNPEQRSFILAALEPVLSEMPDAKNWLLGTVEHDRGLPRFHAAAVAAKLLGKNTPTEVIDALSWVSTGSEQEGVFGGYQNLLFEACTALPVAEGMSVLESWMHALDDCRIVNELCLGLLQVAFEMGIVPRVFGTRTPGPGRGPIFEWSCVRPPRKKLDPERRIRLCRALSQCDRLWTDEIGLPIDTNLFKLFGLPSQRKAMEKLARAGKL